MPVNPPIEYYKAQRKFDAAKSPTEKIVALEEMISQLPKHHGSEQMHAQLKSRLSKLKKEGLSSKKAGGRKSGVEKEGEAQVCILGFTNSGKSTLIKELTNARPKISGYAYTTKKPAVGMINYSGVNVQLVELPATFEGEYLGIARTGDLILILVKDNEEKKKIEFILKDNFIRVKTLIAKSNDDPKKIKENIWKALGLMLVYTKKTNTPMALLKGQTVAKFAEKIHKDFLDHFRYAKVWRKGRLYQAGLRYKLQEGDTVELYLD